MRKISKLKEPRGRVRFLSDEEREALLAACQNSFYPQIYLIVVLALSTGARKSEILKLRWPDIDMEKQQIVLHEIKNGERRTIPQELLETKASMAMHNICFVVHISLSMTVIFENQVIHKTHVGLLSAHDTALTNKSNISVLLVYHAYSTYNAE